MISPQSLHDGAFARPDFAGAAVVRRIALTFRWWMKLTLSLNPRTITVGPKTDRPPVYVE
jgi:hypothetical protein